MLTHSDLKKGVHIILENQPYEILEANPIKKAQRRVVIQTKVRNLLTSNVFERNFHQSDTFEEAGLVKLEARFLYSNRDSYVFCEKQNPSKRFELPKDTIGESSRFLKPNQEVQALLFQERVINVILPIKVQLKVAESPPGIRGDRAQGGTKTVVLESGAVIQVPLFVDAGDIVEVNTENGEYVRRVQE